MLPTALQKKVLVMGVSDAMEMLVREMGIRPQAAMQELVNLMDAGESLPVCVLEEGDWEYTAPDAGVCTFLPA